MEIRKVKKSDCGKYFETGDHAFDQGENGKRLDLSFYYERNKTGNYECFVLENKSEILGVLSLQKRPDSLYLSRIGVNKGYWRRKYGTALLMKVLEKAQEYDEKIITCKVKKSAWKFFENMGFSRLRVYKHPHWGSSALMQLELVWTEK